MNTKEKIEVMQAWLDGTTVEWSTAERHWQEWPKGQEPIWDFRQTFWRIKPKDPVDEAYDRLTANQQFNRVEVDYESFKLGWEACEEAK